MAPIPTLAGKLAVLGLTARPFGRHRFKTPLTTQTLDRFPTINRLIDFHTRPESRRSRYATEEE